MSDTNLKSLVEEISQVFSAQSVIGEPIVQGDKVLVPVLKMGFALGAGRGKGVDRGDEKEGAGVGGGGGLEPIAFIVIHMDVEGKASVELLSLKSPSRIPEVIERAIESIIDRIEQLKPLRKDEEEGDEDST
jgi:uncharacterized spore protein YtfJ